MVDLKFYRVTKIEFENNVQNNTQLNIRHQFKYNVDYIEAENRCVGHIDFTLGDVNMQPFELRIKMDAVFTYEDSDEKPDIHTASFDALFPFLRQAINSITSMSGMQGLIIPLIKIDKSKINVGREETPESSPLN